MADCLKFTQLLSDLLLLSPSPVDVSRATDKVHSILKECSDNLAQAVNSMIPADRSGSAHLGKASSDEAMDTSSGLPPTKQVKMLSNVKSLAKWRSKSQIFFYV